MKQLEPQTTSGIHCLMTTEALEDSFIEALAQVLPQNSTLTTYPLRNTYVEPYEFVVQSSLKPFGNRLDELIYATFKMNEALQQKRDRVKFGFYGNVKTTVQLDFESTHPTYDKESRVRFQMVKVLTEGDQNEHVWEVSKYQGEVLFETTVVSCFASSKMLCSQSKRGKCRVICRKCVQEGHHYMSENQMKYVVAPSCGHALSCTCPDFNSRYSCEHFHVVSLCKDMLGDNSETTFKSSKYNYEVRIVNSIVDSSQMTSSEVLNPAADLSNESKKVLDNSSNISNTVENIVAAFSSELDSSKEEKLKLKQCSVKLERSKSLSSRASTFQHNKNPQSQYDDLRNTAIKRLSGLLASLKKSKKSTIRNRNMCQNVIDFIDNNCPSVNSKIDSSIRTEISTSISEEEEESFSSAVDTGFQVEYDKNVFKEMRSIEQGVSKLEAPNERHSQISLRLDASKRSQSSVISKDNEEQSYNSMYPLLSPERTKSSVESTEPQIAYDTMMSYFIKEREPRWRYQIIGHNSPRFNLLRYVNIIAINKKFIKSSLYKWILLNI